MAYDGARPGRKKVGLFTSPHLQSLRERIRIDGQSVSEEAMQELVQQVLEAESVATRPLTFFEIITLSALKAMDAHDCEFWVLEAGMGGRFDATSIVHSSCTLVTRIGMDHQAFLGNTIAEIASEKASVIREGVPTYTVSQRNEAFQVLSEQAKKVGTELNEVQPLERTPLRFAGNHQRHNAALALAGLRTFFPDVKEEVLDDACWPGRGERLKWKGGEVYLDVAHNQDSIEALVSTIQDEGFSVAVILFGCLPDKDYEGMYQALRGLECPIWLVPPPGEYLSSKQRSDANRTFEAIDKDGPIEALEAITSKKGRVVVCGSHRLVGAIRGFVLDGEFPKESGLSEARFVTPKLE